MVFKVNRYNDFQGSIPDDILRLVPREKQTTFCREFIANAQGRIAVKWTQTESGWPVPVFPATFEFSTKGTF